MSYITPQHVCKILPCNYTNHEDTEDFILKGFSLNFYNFTLYSEPTAGPLITPPDSILIWIKLF